MATETERLMTEELPLIREHFDNQLSAIRSLLEAQNAKQEANHLSQMAVISEVKADVKAHFLDISRLKEDMAYLKGKSEGSRTATILIVAILGVVSGAGGTLIALATAG